MRELAKYVAPPPEAIHDEYLASHVESTVNSDDFSYTLYFHNFCSFFAVVILCVCKVSCIVLSEVCVCVCVCVWRVLFCVLSVVCCVLSCASLQGDVS